VPRALKVFRTAIGFHDAYVAAPSRKAALAAWGTDKDLFARKAAEQVTDPALTKEPLAHPGEVIRVVRGSAAEHVKALGKIERPKARANPKPEPARPARPARPRRPPKPTRELVKLAEDSLRAADERGRARLAELAAREKALAAERKRIERELATDLQRHEARLRRAEQAYAGELAAWEAWSPG